MSILERAILIATQAHKGQVDKTGAPYILHPLRVMFKMDSKIEMITGILHDVIEDSYWSLEDFRIEGFCFEIIQALECLTRREGENYYDFIKRISENELARKVKLADLEDNMNILRYKEITEKDMRRIDRYHKARITLLDEPTLWLPDFLKGNEVARKVLGVMVPNSMAKDLLSCEDYKERWKSKAIYLMRSCSDSEWEIAIDGDLLPMSLRSRYCALRNSAMEDLAFTELMTHELMMVRIMLSYLQNPCDDTKQELTEYFTLLDDDILSPEQEIEEQENLTLFEFVSLL